MLFFCDGQWRLSSAAALTQQQPGEALTANRKAEQKAAGVAAKRFKWDSRDAQPDATATETTSLSQLLPGDRDCRPDTGSNVEQEQRPIMAREAGAAAEPEPNAEPNAVATETTSNGPDIAFGCEVPGAKCRTSRLSTAPVINMYHASAPSRRH